MYRESNVTDAAPITQPWPWEALALCLFGVAGFSFTMPATRIAARELDPLLLGHGRAAVGGALAAVILLVRRERVPARRELLPLAVVSLGVVLGFPLCTSYALAQVPAHHAVVVIGLAPLATATVAVLRNGERPSRAFWLWALLGASSVVAFGLSNAQELRLAPADALLLLAVLLAGLGYAEGGRLAGERSGLSVTCWALVLALPVSLPTASWLVLNRPMATPSLAALACFAWVSVISGLVAFAAWYRGLALGGVARGSQVQLLQPVLSLVWCVLLLGERLSAASLVAGTAILASAAGARWARA